MGDLFRCFGVLVWVALPKMFVAMDGGDKRTGMYSQRFSEGLPPCRHGKLTTLKIRLKPVTNSQVKGFRRETQEEAFFERRNPPQDLH